MKPVVILTHGILIRSDDSDIGAGGSSGISHATSMTTIRNLLVTVSARAHIWYLIIVADVDCKLSARLISLHQGNDPLPRRPGSMPR